MLRLAMLASALFLSWPVSADEMTAGLLYAYCKDQFNLSQEACHFYIQGVVDASKRLPAAKMRPFCAPKALPFAEIVRTFYQRVETLDHVYPQDVKSPAVGVLSETLAEAFPCPQSRLP